jgi:hypothetical protein
MHCIESPPLKIYKHEHMFHMYKERLDASVHQ